MKHFVDPSDQARGEVVEGMDRPLLENCIVDASIFVICGQVFKSTWWMPWQ